MLGGLLCKLSSCGFCQVGLDSTFLIGELQAFASAECISTLSALNSYKLHTRKIRHRSNTIATRILLYAIQLIRAHDILSDESPQVSHMDVNRTARLSRILGKVAENLLRVAWVRAILMLLPASRHALNICSARSYLPSWLLTCDHTSFRQRANPTSDSCFGAKGKNLGRPMPTPKAWSCLGEVGVVVRRILVDLRTALGRLIQAFSVAMILDTITRTPIFMVGVVKGYNTHAVIGPGIQEPCL